MGDLKPCPFCGGTASQWIRSPNNSKWKPFVFVKCDICGAQTRIINTNTEPNDPNWPKCDECIVVTDAWNMRKNNV